MLNSSVFMIFFIFLSYADELGVGNTSNDSSSTDSLYNEFNETAYCSPPPSRGECSTTYANLTGSNQDALSVQASHSSRPCFVDFETRSTAMYHTTENYAVYSIYSTSTSNTYEIDVPISFNLSKLSGDKEKKYSALVGRFQRCLQDPKNKISDGRRTLKINLIPKIENVTSDGRNQVNLHDSIDREDSENFGLNTDCSVLIHEVLHILGLHDEYHEEVIQYTPNQSVFEAELGINLPDSVYDSGLVNQNASDCRRASESPNIMSNSELLSREYALVQCKGFEDTGVVQNNLILQTGNRTCPPGFRRNEIGTTTDFQAITDTYEAAKEITQQEQRRTVDILFYYEAPRGPSLNSRQFDQILHPNCMSKPSVRTYLSRSQNAYRDRYSEGFYGGCIE
ncbi:MAG: hypothetical protein ACRBBP_10360 [Bdellovibrionales bacterium]